jgi:hypothetical protein
VAGLPRGDGWGDTGMVSLGQRPSLHLEVGSGRELGTAEIRMAQDSADDPQGGARL